MMHCVGRGGGQAPQSRRRAVQLCLALALAGMSLAPAFSAPPPENRPAPPFEIKALDGGLFSSENMRGKVVLLTFWATWCHACRAEMTALETFYRQHRRDGFEIVAISVDDGSDEAQVRKLSPSDSFPVALMGTSTIGNYGSISYVPQTFVIDRKGTLRKSAWTGSQKITAASLNKYVLPLLREK